MLPEPWQMYILVPLAVVICAVVWAILDYHRYQSLVPGNRRFRRRELTKFCLQVAVAAPAISVGFYAADAVGIAKGHNRTRIGHHVLERSRHLALAPQQKASSYSSPRMSLLGRP